MKYFLLFFLILTSLLIFSQNYYFKTLSNIFITDATDFQFTDITMDNDLNLYECGFFYSNIDSEYYFITNICDSTFSSNITKIKDGEGNKAYGIEVDENKNIFISGHTFISGNSYDIITIKYDTLFDTIWSSTYNYGSYDYGSGLTIDKNENIISIGYSFNLTDFDGKIIKYDSSGSELWVQTINNGSADYITGVITDSNNNIYVCGYSYISSVYDYIVAKYDSLGTLLWSQTYNNGSTDYARSIALDSTGNIIVSGESYIGGVFNILNIKYDSLGNLLSVDTIQSNNDIRVKDLQISNDNKIFIFGNINISGQEHYLLLEFDTLYNLLWGDTTVFGSNNTYGNALVLNNTESLFITGYYEDSLGENTTYTIEYIRDLIDISVNSILSPNDTIEINSTITPSFSIQNNCEITTLSCCVNAQISISDSIVYTDSVYTDSLLPTTQMNIGFTPWTSPSIPCSATVSYFVSNSEDTFYYNDTISKNFYITTIPLIDSAIAYEGNNIINGIDSDDYVNIYFSEQMQKITIDSSNIDFILLLSQSHSWLDGNNCINSCTWDSLGNILTIVFDTNTSLPTIQIGDTIYPDTLLKDLNGNICNNSIVLQGDFGVSNTDNIYPETMYLNIPLVNYNSINIHLNSNQDPKYTLSIYDIQGRLVKQLSGENKFFINTKITDLSSGIYLIVFKNNDSIIKKRIILLK